MADIMGHEIKDWLPQKPLLGPPLPEFLDIYWPWYKPPTTEFQVSDLVISPKEVTLGQVLTISCLVTNIGEEAGDYTVKLNGDVMADQTVTLQPGESKTVSFEVKPNEAGNYSFSVDGLTGIFTAISVLPFNMTITDTQMKTNYQATAYEAVQFSAVISNPNNVKVSHRLRPAYVYALNQVTPDNPAIYHNRYWDNAQEYIDLTLNPGQSVTLLSPFFYVNGYNEFFQSYEWANPPNVGHHYGAPYKVWLRVIDENNNMSPLASVGTYAG